MTCTDAALAVVLRQLQWALDSVARDVASLTTVRAEELAMLLEETAALVRVSRGHKIVECATEADAG
ncbi:MULTISPECIES: hypothetical protein [Thermocrispum]|uniref:Uncharacterized protein n=1 Tax=Thermocrispum agreste TaxID=37925 RepID=A0ABD6FEH7_9PSEU|nr:MULTISPECIES: hypothetical protein [Thermocrispum]